jgi:hypothetical protein
MVLAAHAAGGGKSIRKKTTAANTREKNLPGGRALHEVIPLRGMGAPSSVNGKDSEQT